MTDEPPQDQPSSGAPQNAEGDFISGEELDDVLAQASSLAAELSEEIGDADGADGSPKAQEVPTGGANLPQELDAELDELQQLVSTTGNEFDADGGADHQDTALKPEPEESSSDEPARKPAGPEVPGFMAEFTQPEKSTESLPSPIDASGKDRQTLPTVSPPADLETGASAGTSAPGRPGVVGSGLIGVVSTRPPAPTAREKPTQPETPDGPPEPTQPISQEGRSTDTPPAAKTRLTLLGAFVCDRAVRLLEWIDRPVAGLGDFTRRVIGWIAVATVGTSVLVYILSLF